MTNKETLHAFGRALRALRRAQNISQQQLGDSSRLGRFAVQALEHGQLDPSFAHVARLARALHLPMFELLAFIEELIHDRRRAR